MKRRVARGNRSKEAAIISQEISLRSSTSTDSNMSTPFEITAAVKPGNVNYSGKPTTRKDVDGFTHDLLNRRWASADLVDHAFDNIVSISSAAKITLCFLHYGVLSVQCDKKKVKRNDWPAACSHAASVARLASKAGKVTKDMKERYSWSWSKHLSTGTERGAQQFLNIVGILGYIFANLFDLDSNGLSERRLRNRITTLPRAYSRLLLESPDSQDCWPDFFALHRSAFATESERDPEREREYMEKPSILLTIDSFWPQLNKKYPSVFPSSSQKDVANSNDPDDEERSIGELSFTPEGHDELLDDVGNGKYTADEGNEDVDTSSEEAESVADLSLQLQELLKILESDNPILSDSVSADVREYGTATFLDLSAVCFPNMLIPGEGRQTDMRSAIVQATVYMRQQRQTQPWLRFCLGLMATKDKMGLLRADATGVEECIFSKNIGRGVIESIRLSLGILLATDHELGQHPSFSLRSVTKIIAEPEDDSPTATVGTKRPAVDDDNDRRSKKQRSQTSGNIPSTPPNSPIPPKRFTFREVNWITLDTERLHGQSLAGKPPTVFYVKHLIEDRGSLIGRCTRVWCVYQEVLESDPSLNPHRHEIPEGSRVFKGPFALKLYNADMYSEAYEQDILVKAMEINTRKKIKGVLLPTQYDACVNIPHFGADVFGGCSVWYLGEISTLVRGLTQEECPPTIPSSKVKHRQEIFTISALKRTLSQFETMGEFYDAIIGVLRAIESLQTVKMMHRDISFGNIILNDEIYCDTDKNFQWIDVVQEDSQRACVALIRRDPADIGTIGGLHDLDMAAYIPKTEFTNDVKMPPIRSRIKNVTKKKSVLTVQQKPQRDWRTGTQPFMSIPILLGGQHSVYEDLQSLFFVCYLSLFTFGERLPNCFPNAAPPLIYSWPQACRRWSDIASDVSTTDVGLRKQHFFMTSDVWYETAKSEALSLWNASNKVLKWMHWDILYAFHQELWKSGASASKVQKKTSWDNAKVKPSSIIKALKKIRDGMDMNSDEPVPELYQ